jgi:oligoendopeptidase F
MFSSLPDNAIPLLDWDWSQIEPYFQELVHRPLNETNLSAWLADWSQMSNLMDESYWRLYDGTSIDTTDKDSAQRYSRYLDDVQPKIKSEEQKLKKKLLASGLEPKGYETPLRNLRTQADLFREENLELLSLDKKLQAEYEKIIGAQTVMWDGEEITLPKLLPVYQEPDRERRENAWRLAADRQLGDREKIDDLWAKLFDLRGQIAGNADMPSYRSYRWKELLRFDYTPKDCAKFRQAIKEVIVPAARSVYEKRRRKLGLETLKPWDLEVDPFGLPALKPFNSVAELENKTFQIFQQVDPQLGEYFEIMRRDKLLDLDNRKGKAPGGYCNHYRAAQRPFIFMNAVGIHDDVQTLLHEGGHAFHVFECGHLPYFFLEVPIEFAEVASTAMELLSGQFLTNGEDGFYDREQAARAQIQFLDRLLLFWPYMAVVDAFQHWAYENPEQAIQSQNCDQKWGQLWEEFMPVVDWSGLEAQKVTGWQRKEHIFVEPFYYIEYGLAQVGAIQIWRNALDDQAGAIAAYRQALALGSSVTLGQLYETAGAKFAFDAATLTQAADLTLKMISELESEIN